MPTTLGNCPAPECREGVSPLGSYVKERGEYWHVNCYMRPHLLRAKMDARDEIHNEQQEKKRIAEEMQAVERKAIQERDTARALAQRNAEAERNRIAALERQERERLKLLESKGEAQERFTLIEVATDEEVAAQEAARKAQADALAAKQAADASTCVRCRQPMASISAEHPRHCSKCWMDESTGQKGDLSQQNLEKLVKDGLRPLELE